MFDKVHDPQNYVVILRFLGTSPATSSINNTFLSVLYQLERLFDLNISDKNLTNINDLRDYLHKAIVQVAGAHPTKRVVFFFDSIDQLIPTDYDLTWFIADFPKNIKFVYSTLINHGGIVSLLKRHCLPGEKNYTKVAAFNKLMTKKIFDQWLASSKRCLTRSQTSKVEQLFDQAKLYPLYLKMIFDLVVEWPSYQEPDEEFMRLFSVDDCIRYLFEKICKEHGRLVVTKALTYLSLFETGIMVDELVDILSVDDEVLDDVFRFYTSSVRRYFTFPYSAAWSF